MKERSTQMLLTVAIVVAGLLLLRPAYTSPQQSALTQTSQGQPVVAADSGLLYIVSNNKIYCYYWDDPKRPDLMSKTAKLKLLQTTDAKMDSLGGAKPEGSVVPAKP